MNAIPASTKNNVPSFWGGVFSNDKSRMLIDGLNTSGELVHANSALMSWLQWESNPQATLNIILSTSIEYTQEQYEELTNDDNSIWHMTEVAN